jgi:type IV fimbrial biogenesis protein FimT
VLKATHPLPRPRQERGFNLIELMIGVALIAILMVVALPEFSTWLHNTKIRTAAESVIAGMQLARAEAVRRNVNVQFAFGTGTAWTVSVPSTAEQIQTRSAAEGGTGVVTIAMTPGTATRLTFNSLGRTTANADASSLITQVDVDVPTTVLPAAKSRELRIVVGTGGNVRMCDPNVTTSGDPRSC